MTPPRRCVGGAGCTYAPRQGKTRNVRHAIHTTRIAKVSVNHALVRALVADISKPLWHPRVTAAGIDNKLRAFFVAGRPAAVTEPDPCDFAKLAH